VAHFSGSTIPSVVPGPKTHCRRDQVAPTLPVMSNRISRSLITLAAAAVLALGGGVPAALAKHGADDPPSHNVRDDHGGKRHARSAKHHQRHGKHHRRAHHRHGNDDGPNHT
jgi:hypothetical protein